MAYPTESIFCEAVFFIQGLLIVSWIANDEADSESNPIKFGGQKLVNFLRESGGLRQVGEMHNWLWEFKHSLELYMPLALIFRMPLSPWVQTRALLFWWAIFPFRFVTSVTVQKVVSQHDRIFQSWLMSTSVPTGVRSCYMKTRRYCKNQLNNCLRLIEQVDA